MDPTRAWVGSCASRGFGDRIKDCGVWDEHGTYLVPSICCNFQGQPSFGDGHSCVPVVMLSGTLLVFSTVRVLSASGRQTWVQEGRCIPWAHAGQEATVRANAMLASLLSLHVSV